MAKLPLAPFEKILKGSESDIRVSESATKAFVEIISEISKEMARDAAELAKHAGRKTILSSDIKLASKRK